MFICSYYNFLNSHKPKATFISVSDVFIIRTTQIPTWQTVWRDQGANTQNVSKKSTNTFAFIKMLPQYVPSLNGGYIFKPPELG